ncbi:unnamed protein product [Coffea canephora]|uniref:Uncharacterized protein n=1 Tax=Coffea canephora TaxID=49390 RepID=A0A068UK51_COFCA|nr:unnamed protein product [Coffea canephora]
MAVAEARAAWQRTVNRCLVQEDAKRAPKLAYCPLASPFVREVEVGPANAAEAQDISSVAFPPFNQSTSFSNLSPNSKWWLQLPSNYRHQRGLTDQQLNCTDSEMETFHDRTSSALKMPESEDGSALFYDSIETESFVDSDLRILSTGLKKDTEVGDKDLTPMNKLNPQCSPKLEDVGDLYERAEIGTYGCTVSKKKNELFPDSESPWIGDEKIGPWWRTADQDELALLVSRGSFGLIENCDLPQPQNTCVEREAFVDLCCFDHDRACISPTDPKHPGCHHDLIVHKQSSIASQSDCQKQRLSVDEQLQSSTITSLRDSSNQDAILRSFASDSDSSKAQLLEALRHSQTRAREAEKAAKQAYAEKEHVVKLVFRQASQLFAYKQWFQLLQLENLCYQIKNNKGQPISTLFPVMLPWVPQKTRKLRKNWQKAARGKRAKRGRPRSDISRYAVVFALGLSLVGAGLLLGWTVGWMLPTF